MILLFSHKTVNPNSFQLLKENILAQVSQMPRSILTLGNPKVKASLYFRNGWNWYSIVCS